ncbi:MAG: cobalamin biosynthesis protein CbiG [Herbaspirillum sp.]|jgi:cobalt-precorrin 5A hydrolase|nr:cobalamin biosynthesis protein CbiG [Herbaspirillum sp.]
MNEELSIGIWPVRVEGEALAQRLQEQLGGTIYRPWLQAGLPQKSQFAAAYAASRHRQWIVLAATGIALRFLNGMIRDKHSDPAVVLLDEGGRFAVSLLGGHEGGANRLTYRVANAVGAVPVVTTATEALKPFVIGIGCRKGVPVERIEAAVLTALQGRSLNQVREIATIDLKADEPGLLAFSAAHNIPLRIIARDTVAARAWIGKPSEWVQQNIGLDGVCEPCALIACGRGKLVVPKTTLEGVAVAIVQDLPDEPADDRSGADAGGTQA